MQKRGLVAAVIVLFIVGFAIGYYIPKWQSKQSQANLMDEASYDSKGYQLLQDSNYRRAAVEFNEYLGHFPNNFYAHLGKAWALYFSEEYQQSISSFQKAHELVPTHFSPNLGMALCNLALKNYENALDEYSDALVQGVDHDYIGLAFTGQGFALQKSNEHDKALIAFNNAIAIEYQSVMPHVGLMISYIAVIDKERTESESKIIRAWALDQNKNLKFPDEKAFNECIQKTSIQLADIERCGSGIYG